MKALFTFLLIFVLNSAFAQWGVAFYQSHFSHAGVNYPIGKKWLPEFRVGLNTDLDNISPEVLINYLFIKKASHQFYAGFGGRAQIDEGLVLPVGLNIYPFEDNNFGFHTEIAIIKTYENAILRGFWGIRYRFGDRKK